MPWNSTYNTAFIQLLHSTISITMLYQNIIFTGFALSTTVQAAVNFYGPDRDQGDYVTCQFKDVPDEDVSAFPDFFYPAQIIDGSNDFAFEKPVECSKGALHDAEEACQDAGGDTTCIPFRKKICLGVFGASVLCLSQPSAKRSVLHRSIGRQSTAPVKKSDSELESDERRSVGYALERRDGAKCDRYTFAFRNEYQSTSGYCSSGYTVETFEVQGSTGDTWCSKPCTDQEVTKCKTKACVLAKEDCETNKGTTSCEKALLECASHQIKMDQSICNLDHLGSYGMECTRSGRKGVTYKDGHSSLIIADRDAYFKGIQSIVFSGFGRTHS
jgi:hypothetical protein